MYEIKLNSTYFLSLLSAVIVCIMFNLFIKNEIDYSYMILDIYDVNNMVSQGKNIIITTIVINRLKQMVLLIILMKAFGGKNIYNIVMMLLGGVLGFVLSAQIYYLGLSGVLIILAYIFPHYVFYILAMVYENNSGLFELGNKDNIKKISTFVMIFTVGVIFECLFMTFFLKNFHQYMVS
ncbi:MAG: hypothetical protein E7257_02520 [Lachnospiraceae bacterium]|nr:hypothetical protein [Lachnospiraceae bacterium]MBQ9936096.1 hypothetical protein [Lachnospiraceae bacterium]